MFINYEWTDKQNGYVHTMEQKRILRHAPTLMNLENIVLSVQNQTKNKDRML